MSGEASNLVSKSLCLNDGNIVNDSLIYMEVVGQPLQSKHSSYKDQAYANKGCTFGTHKSIAPKLNQ